MFAYLLAEGRRRPARVLGSLAGVVLGVALFVSLVAAADGFSAAAREPLSDVGADILISSPVTAAAARPQTNRGIREPFGLAPLSTAQANQLRQIPGVNDVSAALLLWDFAPNSYQTLLGVDVTDNGTAEPARSPDQPKTQEPKTPGSSGVGPEQVADSIVAGRFFTGDESGVVVVDQHYAAFYALKPRAVVDIGERSFQVIGIVDVGGANQAASANFYLSLSDARSLAGLGDDQINQFYLSVDEATEVDAVVAAAKVQLGEISATTQQSIVSVTGGITEVSDKFAKVAALTALLGGLLLAAVTLHSGIKQRTREIGVMKATGWRARDVVRLFVLEGIIFSALGATLGVALGWLTIAVFAQIPIEVPSASQTTPELSGATSIDSYTINAGLSVGMVLLAVVTAVLVGGLVTMVSARRTSRLKPADALRY